MTFISPANFASSKMPGMVTANQANINNGSAFSEILNPNHATSENGMTLHQAAEKLVSSALLMPIIEQLHSEHGFRSEMFKAGDAERHFQPIMDYYLADQIVSGANFDLTESVVQRLQPQVDGGGLQA